MNHYYSIPYPVTLLLCSALWFASPPLLAGPMGFKDSIMLMGDVSRNWRDWWVNYAVTSRDAFGVGTLYMRSDDESIDRDLNELTYTRLVKRWNFPHAQANIWFPVGIGEIRGNDFSGCKTVFRPGLQLDYETQRVYVAASYRAYRADDINHDFASARAGFSFYEAHYEQTQPWFIPEARRMRDLSEKTEITPMLRLNNNRYFIEAGYSNMPEARFTLMYIF